MKRRDWEQAGSSAAKRYCQEELHQDLSDSDAEMAEAEAAAEEEEADEEQDEEAIAERRIKLKDELVPEIRSILGSERPDLLTDRTPRRCLVCPTMQLFTGWRALSAHARTITTKRVQRHRAYHLALEEVLKSQAKAAPERDVSGIRVKPIAAMEKREAVTPPVVVVRNAASVDEVRGYIPAEVQTVVESLVEVKEVILVVFRPGAGVQAAYLVKIFEDENLGRDSRVIGCAAQPEDMERLDPERQIVDWSLAEILDYGQKAKEQMKATVAAFQAKHRTSKLEEETKAMLEDMSKVEQQFVDKPNEIEKLKKANAVQKDRFEGWCEREQTNSQRELRDMETFQEKKWKQLNMELDFAHRKTEKQRIEHLEHLERVKEKCNSGTEQAKANSAMLLELEDEKTSFEKSLKTAEDALTMHFRLRETELMEEHNKEIEALSVKYAEQSEDCLKRQECVICLEELGNNERARCLLNPCGHATVCMACSDSIADCPICRTPIKSKMPLAASQPFYG